MFQVSRNTRLFEIITYNNNRGRDIDCGCFSGIERKANWLAISEALNMFVYAVFIFFFDRAGISLALLIKKILFHRNIYKGALS
jgi:hypothetical protein